MFKMKYYLPPFFLVLFMNHGFETGILADSITCGHYQVCQRVKQGTSRLLYYEQ
jgi:hypothetical protein